MNNIIIQKEPPKELQPATAEIIFRRKITKSGMTAVVVDLAVRGYIKIEKESDSNYILIKTKSYENDTNLRNYEVSLLKSFFDSKDYFSKQEIKKDDNKLVILSEKMADVRKKMFDEINNDKNISLESFKVERRRNIVLMRSVMFLVSYLLLYLFFNFPTSEPFPFQSGLAFVIYLLFNKYVLIVTFIIFILNIIRIWKKYQVNPKSDEMALKNKLLGFKDFLEAIVENKISDFKNEYFERYLPYAIVFGMGTRWINKFESENLSKPTWYSVKKDTERPEDRESIFPAFEFSNNYSSVFFPYIKTQD